MSRELTREIAGIKKESFSELKFTYIRGIYLPDYHLLSDRKLGRIKFHGYGWFLDEKLQFAVGFANLMLPQGLSHPRYISERRGIIAHELSHITSGVSSSERDVESEAIKRGYAHELMKVIGLLEDNGMRSLTYTRKEIAEMV